MSSNNKQRRSPGVGVGNSSRRRSLGMPGQRSSDKPSNIKTVITLDEYKQVLDDNEGKMVVVRFFATWCKVRCSTYFHDLSWLIVGGYIIYSFNCYNSSLTKNPCIITILYNIKTGMQGNPTTLLSYGHPLSPHYLPGGTGNK